MLLGACNIHLTDVAGCLQHTPDDVAGCRSDGTSVLQQEAAPLWPAPVRGQYCDYI